MKTFHYKYCETLCTDYMLTFYLLTDSTLNFYYIYKCVYVIVHTCMCATANMWCSEENFLA